MLFCPIFHMVSQRQLNVMTPEGNCHNTRQSLPTGYVQENELILSVFIVGLSYAARNVLSYLIPMMQNFLAFRDSPIIPYKTLAWSQIDLWVTDIYPIIDMLEGQAASSIPLHCRPGKRTEPKRRCRRRIRKLAKLHSCEWRALPVALRGQHTRTPDGLWGDCWTLWSFCGNAKPIFSSANDDAKK